MQTENSATIRSARDTDTEAMCRIAVQAWEPIYAERSRMLGSELFSASHGDVRRKKAEQIRRHVSRYPEWTFVTVIGTLVAGFLTYELDRKTKIGTIFNNAIDPDCQGQGLGTKQYYEVLRIFRENGMKWAKVGTGLADSGHAAARVGYEKEGFTQKKNRV